MSVLSSRDNPKVRHWRKLSDDARYRSRERRALIEGPHLLAAALHHRLTPVAILATEKGAADPEIGALIARSGARPVLVTEALLRSVVDVETPQGVAAEIDIPAGADVDGGAAVFLEGVQDPANVGAIVRTAAAFGVRRLVLDPACADPWSPKALRAGMGGHFALHICETKDLAKEMGEFRGTVICTVVRDGVPLAEAAVDGHVAWVFGGEGRGLSDATLKQADLTVTIPTAAGTESLNVAAAAAVCLYEACRKSGSDPDFGKGV